jgi:hypothetical protein
LDYYKKIGKLKTVSADAEALYVFDVIKEILQQVSGFKVNR